MPDPAKSGKMSTVKRRLFKLWVLPFCAVIAVGGILPAQSQIGPEPPGSETAPIGPIPPGGLPVMPEGSKGLSPDFDNEPEGPDFGIGLKPPPASAGEAPGDVAVKGDYSVRLDAYLRALEDWQRLAANSSTRMSLETVLEKGQDVVPELLEKMDKMDDAQFDAVQKRMKGYIVNRDELLVVSPDPAFYLEQARAHGTPADIAFFEAMGKTLNGYWPMTMEQMTDFTGCIRYGSGDLVKLYGLWQDFKRLYPGAYKEALADPNLLLLSDVEDQLINGLSACDSPENVRGEYEAFLQAYPQSPLVDGVRQRLHELLENDAGMVFYQGVKYQSP